MNTIHWLGDVACQQVGTVGGKAANLSRFAATYPVPPGFAVPAISATRGVIAPELRAAIEQAYQELGQRCGEENLPVAVRSSAVDEDGSQASFAGQHATYLNVRGAEAVTDAVERCLRSALSSEALNYRSERGLQADDIRMAILVQQLVPADVAGVAFSCNPITGDRREVMITTNWGLGESVVGGTATPDTFVVQKHDFAVSLREIACKSRMTVLREHGTEDAATPADLQSAESLSDEQAVAIARLAVSLEEREGLPVDIECAIAAGTLYLLQCRPITTLS